MSWLRDRRAFARAACGVCAAPFGPTPPVAAGRLGSLLFACIHDCDFACSACGLRSPLATLELDGQVECMRCGLTQAFDAVQWTDALGHAHDVVDLAGPNPEGANAIPGRSIAGRSMHARIGTEFTSSTKTQNSLIMDGAGTRKHTLKTTVSPGHPLCKACHVPLEVSLAEPGITRTRCPRCNDGATYALPSGAAAVSIALRGIIATENRTDKPVARPMRGEGGVEAIGCPQCGAALTAGAGEIVKCTFCSVTARVPGKLARRQKKGEPPKIEPFWVLLDGLSPGRTRLLRGRREDDDDDDDDDDGESFSAGFAPASSFAGAPGAAAAQMRTGLPSWAHPNIQMQSALGSAPSRSRSTVPLMVGAVVVALGLLLAALGGAFYVLQSGDDAPPPPKAGPKSPPPKRH